MQSYVPVKRHTHTPPYHPPLSSRPRARLCRFATSPPLASTAGQFCSRAKAEQTYRNMWGCAI